MPDSPPAGLRFTLEADGHRYRALLGEVEVAYSEVDPIGADGLLIKHTEVLPSHEGQGIGGALVRHMLEESRRQGRGVIPTCPYALAFIRRHHEYRDYVRK